MRDLSVGPTMATKVTSAKCHICDERWDVDFMIDDDPNGMICVPCNELAEQGYDDNDEEILN